MHPQMLIKGFRKACMLAKNKINELAVSIDAKSPEERRALLERCASTSLSSKLVAGQSAFFSKMVVDAVERLDEDLDLDMIGMKKIRGGSLQESQFIEGVAFKKTFSYAGYEQSPKIFENPKILLLNVELEWKSEKENAEIRINNPADYQKFVDAEWNIIYGKLDAIRATGANIVLSRLAIGDLAQQYFADHGMFSAGRVPEEDLVRVSKATSGKIQTSTNKIESSMLGTCGLFEERQTGSKRYLFFTKCTQTKSATIILRGGGKQFIDEAERSLHDAIMIVRRASKHKTVVGGGGAIEMELSKYLKDYALTIPGKQQMIISIFAKALEVIPRQLADNAGLDSTDVLNQLRKAHADGKNWAGVNLASDAKSIITDSLENYVWEPALVKLNSLEAATEAACMILSVDETVKNPKVDNSLPNAPHRRAGGAHGGMGMPMQ